MLADHKQMKQEMREQAKLAREQSRSEQMAQRDERQAASAQAKADHVQQRELRTQAKLEHSADVQKILQKMRTSAESLLAQTRNMVDREWAALQEPVDEYAAKADAFSEALARPIDPR